MYFDDYFIFKIYFDKIPIIEIIENQFHMLL